MATPNLYVQAERAVTPAPPGSLPPTHRNGRAQRQDNRVSSEVSRTRTPVAWRLLIALGLIVTSNGRRPARSVLIPGPPSELYWGVGGETWDGKVESHLFTPPLLQSSLSGQEESVPHWSSPQAKEETQSVITNTQCETVTIFTPSSLSVQLMAR